MTSASAPGTAARETRLPLLGAALLVALLGFVAHAPSLDAGFVYDDHRFIAQNEAIRSIDPVAFFTVAETTSAGEGIVHDIYRPLRTLLFSIEYALFELDAGRWHLVSLLLHALNAALVLVLLTRYLRGHVLAAAVGAALFAVHPITSESVAWISSQGDLLALTFMLLALLAFQRTGLRASVIGSVLFLLACFAKESALVLPALVYLQRLVLRGSEGSWREVGKETWVRIGVLALLVVVYWSMRTSVVPVTKQIPYPGGFLGTVRGMFEGMTWYAATLFWPQGFSFDLQYEPPLSFGEPMVVAGLGVFVTVVAAGVWGLRTRRFPVAFMALGFLACLVPVSNVIVPLKTFIADRFMYPGLVCLALGVALLARQLAVHARAAVPFVAGAAVIVLLFLTMGRARAWADEMTLWKAVRADRPTNANAYQGIAYELAKEARISDAERAFRTYIGFNPIDGKAWMRLGDTFARAAESLDPTSEIAQGTDMRLRRQQARSAQISAYREAFRIWNTFGLAVGRGSEAMQRRMFVRWLAAADELGDIGEMKRVNDLRTGIEQGVDPSDPDAFWADARWVYKATRFRIAMIAFQKQVTKMAVPRDQLDRVLRDRAAVFRDVQLDPGLGDDQLRAPFARFFEAQIVRADDAGERVGAQSFVPAVLLLLTIEDKRAARALHARALQRHPRNGRLLQLAGAFAP
ncbi:MAG: hypothetical protein QNJ98_04125 [Planctomycetota bacterium]|nr:hypothetical protein [Planctomycetota bacterium]